jgi:hypothetical protein
LFVSLIPFFADNNYIVAEHPNYNDYMNKVYVGITIIYPDTFV